MTKLLKRAGWWTIMIVLGLIGFTLSCVFLPPEGAEVVRTLVIWAALAFAAVGVVAYMGKALAGIINAAAWFVRKVKGGGFRG